MQTIFNFKFWFFVLILFCLTWLATSDAISCDSCGRECTSACGTKHFRTCCFNYLRKRSSPPSSSNTAEIEILTAPASIPYGNNILTNNNNDEFSSVEQKLENWLKNTKDMENVLRKAIDLDRMQINKKKKLNNDENVLDF